MAVRVEWRDHGHQLAEDDPTAILRFEVADLNQVIKHAAAASPQYVHLQHRGGIPAHHRVLPLSCFAIAAGWTPARLAAGTRYPSYRQVQARVLLDAGFALWPTAILDDNSPDPRNEVHFDLIALAGADLHLDQMAGSRSERATARNRLRPKFDQVLRLLGDPVELPGHTS